MSQGLPIPGRLPGMSIPVKNRNVKGKTGAIVFKRKEPPPDAVLSAGMKKLNLKHETSTETKVISDFEDMGLKEELLKGIRAHGLEKPATCQANTIPKLIEGRDVVCQAQSGMGKTAAFCISVLQRLDENKPECKALVLAPTRELAEQILDEFNAFAKYMPHVRIVGCIGLCGKFGKNLEEMVSGRWNIAVGTLGRIAHILMAKNFNSDVIKMLVIDEADKMIMDRSFTSDMALVIRSAAWDAQIVIASATMPKFAIDQAKKFMRNPFEFRLSNDQLTLDGIQQYHVNVGNEEGKFLTLQELYPLLKQARGICFCNTRNRAKRLEERMAEQGHDVPGMIGTMDQADRNSNLRNFRNGTIRTLIASDLLGRGVDIHHVQLVINYDIPKEGKVEISKEQYIHRVGRAGRFGKKGMAITFVTDSEIHFVKQLEDWYHTTIPPMPAHVGRALAKLQ